MVVHTKHMATNNNPSMDFDYSERPEGHHLECSHCARFDTWNKPQGDDKVICWDCAEMHAVECYCGCWPLRRDYNAIEETCPDCEPAKL